MRRLFRVCKFSPTKIKLSECGIGLNNIALSRTKKKKSKKKRRGKSFPMWNFKKRVNIAKILIETFFNALALFLHIAIWNCFEGIWVSDCHFQFSTLSIQTLWLINPHQRRQNINYYWDLEAWIWLEALLTKALLAFEIYAITIDILSEMLWK